MNLIGKIAIAGALVAAIGTGAALAHMGRHGPMGGPMMGRLCEAKTPITGERIAERLGTRLKLTDGQKPALKDLQEAFAKSVNDARALCDDKPDLSTVPGRMAFAQKRMSTMVAGMANVQPRLEAFYAGLDDAQKAEFNDMGPMGGHHREHRRWGWGGHWGDDH